MNQVFRNLSPISLCMSLAMFLSGCQQQQSSPVFPIADSAAKQAQLQQQQAAAAQAQHDEELKKQVEANKEKSRSYYVANKKTWQTYVP